MIEDRELEEIKLWPGQWGYKSLLVFAMDRLDGLAKIETLERDTFRILFGENDESRKVLQCLRKNKEFWQKCWYSSNRNFVFVFCIPEEFLC